MNEDRDFSIKRMNVLLEEIKGEFRSVSEGHDAVVKKLGDLEAKLDGRMDKLDGRMDKLDGRMDGLEVFMERQSKDIMNVLGESNQKIDGILQKIQEYENRIMVLEKQ